MTGTRRALLAPALLAVALLTACGGSGDGGDSGTVDAAPGGEGGVTSTPGEAGTDLTIVVDDGAGKKTTWKLTCDPAGGDHPAAQAACAELEKNGETALPPVGKDRMCTQIFGGPETATITGTWKGADVSSTLSKANGCELGRWNSLSAVLTGSPSPSST